MQDTTQAHHHEVGQGVTEYALILSSIVIVIIVILNVLTASTRNTFDNLMCNLQPGGTCPSLAEQLQQGNPGNWSGGGGSSTSTPTPTNTVPPGSTATNTPPPGSTATPTQTPVPTETPTPTATTTPANTATSAPTATPTEGPTATPTETPTSAPTSTPTPTETPTSTPTPEPPLNIYVNTALESGWMNWSWGLASGYPKFNATGNYNSPGSSIRVDTNQTWAALYLRSQTTLPSGYTTLSFFIKRTNNGPNTFQVQLYNQAGQATNAGSFTLSNNSWQQINIAIGSYGSSNLWGIAIQDGVGDASGRFFIDDIQLERN
mgnify:CR=1 FL=1